MLVTRKICVEKFFKKIPRNYKIKKLKFQKSEKNIEKIDSFRESSLVHISNSKLANVK